jgi:transcriptional antiterminator
MTQPHTFFIFGEGRRDRNFLIALIENEKFKHHTAKWTPSYGNHFGCSAADILKQCQKEASKAAYDLVICLIDLDDLKTDFPDNWGKKKIALENKYANIAIIWQIENAEDEYIKVLGEKYKKKGETELNKIVRDNINKFINTDLYKRILAPIKNKEQLLSIKENKKTN